jgi:small-conductance mechanosensitive channel
MPSDDSSTGAAARKGDPVLEALQNGMTGLRDTLAWAPDNVAGAVLLALAALIALSIHRTMLRLLRRLLRDRHPYMRSFLAWTVGLTRMALIVFALSLTLPLTPLDAETTAIIGRILLLATIIIIGWAAIATVNMSADLYLMRFRLDSTDNVLARKHLTQVRVLTRTVDTLLVLVTVGAALMTFEPVRQYGVSLFASAGVAGLVAGLAARPVLSNLIAGIQLAMTQPIRIDDGVLVEGEYGRVEEITSTYVVIRLWDLRRLIVPLTYFIEKPFQNWTRESSSLIGAALFHLDYTTPVERVRQKLIEIVTASPLWDGNVVKLQVVEARESSLELRAIASARTSSDAFDLRCEIREKLIDWMQREIPTALPRTRQEVVAAEKHSSAPGG